MRIANKEERRFYEIEIANNGWSFREFQRQYDSSLYERLPLGITKDNILHEKFRRNCRTLNAPIYEVRYGKDVPQPPKKRQGLFK